MAENPYAHLRKLTKTSQKDFAEKHAFAKTTMTYVESGQYPDLSDNMIVALGKECFEKRVDAKEVLRSEYNAEDLQTAYHSWQSLERLQSAHLFRQPPTGESTKELSPFHFLIKATTGSVQAFCKTLKVPSASVLRYASGLTRTMPAVLSKALREVQFPYMAELEQAQEQWWVARG